jgi:molybdenum cofactor cytidylyltransferase
VAVVLAAGSSRRMGEQHKLLAKLNGAPMVSLVVDAVLSSAVLSTTVVVGYRGGEVRAALKDCDVRILENVGYGKGLASSLKVGLSSLPAEIEGAMIVLADMPFVGADLIDRLVAAFGSAQNKNIIVPMKSGRLGNPVIWPVRFFPEIMQLDGDAGAKALLKRFSESVTTLPVLDDAAFFDVDTPSELERAKLKVDAALPKKDSQQSSQ